MEFDRPQSRNEAILQNMLGASNLLEPPQSRVEALLQDIAGQMPEANPSEGTTTGTLDRLKIGDEIYSVEGGGGTINYNDLSHQPQIGGITLKGNKSASDLGLQNALLYGATNPTGGNDGDLYLKTTSAGNADVFGTPSANTGDGYEITTDVSTYQTYEPYKAFGEGDGFGKNGAGRATLIYHVTSGKKYNPKSVSLCNNFDVTGGYLTSNSTVISGSLDGENWNVLATVTTLAAKGESVTVPISTNEFYPYFKFEMLANTGYPGIKNIVLIGESDSEEDNKIDDIFFKQDETWLKYTKGGVPKKKQRKYTGGGSDTNIIDFGDETPICILAIYPEPDESVTTNDYNMIDCFSFGQILIPGHWSVKSGNLPITSGNHGMAKVVASYAGNVISIKGNAPQDCCNVSGMKYVIDYLA